MQGPTGITRVMVVLLDGLRADAIPLYQLAGLQALIAEGRATLTARTVSPSITSAAVTSLLTGVAPAVHGIATDRIRIPRGAKGLTSLPACLSAHGIPTFGFRASVPLVQRPIARQIARRLGAAVQFAGAGARGMVNGIVRTWEQQPAGLWFCHFPDADLAGHRWGWNSPAYRQAVEEYDRVVALLVDALGLCEDPSSVLIVTADHGGGGRVPRHHASEHPLDTTIPLIISGSRVLPGSLLPGASLLDVPATIPWLLGAPTPASYQGRILVESVRPTLVRSPGLGRAA